MNINGDLERSGFKWCCSDIGDLLASCEADMLPALALLINTDPDANCDFLFHL